MKSISADELYALAGISPTGTTCWGDVVPSKKSGVYVISVNNLTSVCFKENFNELEGKFWYPDQEIVYIGRTRELSKRLRRFKRHIYGASSPHHGGQAILLLDSPKIIRWAEVDNFADAEDRLIKAFQGYAGRMPFGNRVRSARMKIN